MVGKDEEKATGHRFQRVLGRIARRWSSGGGAVERLYSVNFSQDAVVKIGNTFKRMD
jgi:hypothetical protein